MAPRAILFDAAGTLFRVRGSVGEVYAAVAARHGVSVAAEDIERRFRAAFRSVPPMCFPGVPDVELAQRERAWWRHVVTTAFAGAPFTDFETFFADLFAYFACGAAWELFPDAEPTLAALKGRGTRLGIVSNFDGRLLAVCDDLGIANCFEAIVMSGRVGYAKPDPRIFAIALERLGTSAADALHVGDSESEDIAGAHAAGLRAVLIQRDAPADRSRHRIGDLRELLTFV